MKYLILLFIFLTTFRVAVSQTSYQNSENHGQGTMDVKGTVIDAKTNEPIIGANVIIKGTLRGSTTDLDGNFMLESVPKGNLTVTVSYVSYKPYEQTFFISDEKDISLKIALEQDIVQIKAVNVVGSKITDTDISMMQTIKSSNLVVNGVPSQMIKKTQDRDAGEVVKRIPGITIQDGRFIVIRGLNERYNSVWLNNLPAPSSEADVRAFSFDFIPASMIDNIVVYKTFSPELPGDFAGGLVQISTIINPEKNFLQVSYSNSYSEGSTFQEHKLYPISAGGLWNNTSDLNLASNFPTSISSIPSTEAGKDEKTIIGQSMNKIWSPQSMVAPTDQRLSVAGAWHKDLGKFRIANYTQLNYGTTFNQDIIYRASYNSYDEAQGHPDTSYYFNDVQYNNSVKTGAMMNWALMKGKSKIEFRNIFNNISTNRVTNRDGRDFYGGITLRGLEMTAKTRNMYSGQLSGSHSVGKNESQIKWFAGYSASNQNMPDNKRLTWVKNDQEDSPYYEQYGLNFSFSANSNLSGRIFHTMSEQIVNAGSDFSSKIKIKSTTIEYKTGFFLENRSRDFSARNLGYKIARTSLFDWTLPYETVETVFSNDYINTTDGIMIDEQTNPSDSYNSESSLYAGFFAVNIPFGSRIKIYTGLRAEQSRTELFSYEPDATNPPTEADKVHYLSDTLLLLPAINASFSMSERSQLRFAYGQTVNRPEYREIAPMSYYDYELKAVISGNDSLTFASINNFDLRYEFYPNAFSMFSFGAFYKQFKNAIEYKIIPTGSGLQYTFQNTPEARVAGLETEMRLAGSALKTTGIVRNFTIVFNAAYVTSTINFGDASLEEKRALQGQSPYVVNAAVFYQNDSIRINAGLMYNVVGKRISFVGDPYTGNPHIYEMPNHQIDFSFGKLIGKHLEVKANVKNLLSRNVVYCQDVETESGTKTQTTMSYNPGRYYTLGFVWKF